MSEVTLSYLFVFTLSLCLSLFFVPIVKKIGLRFNIVDKPGNRKVHKQPIPCIGGFAIYLVIMVVVFGSLFSLYLVNRSPVGAKFIPQIIAQIPLIEIASLRLIAIMGGATVILGIGLLDDIVGVMFDYRLKLFIEILIAFLLTLFGIKVDFLGNDILNSIVTIIWIVGITNAFNLLDNMDGLSSGVAHICCMLLFFVAARQEQFFVALLFLSIAGSLLGFLYFNYHPAKIFLGDTGALFIGFMIATGTVLQSFGTVQSQSFFPILMPLIIMSMPIWDTTRVVFIRFLEGRPIFQGDQRHISHRLVEMGMTQRQAVLTVYVMTFALGIGCTVLDLADPFINYVIVSQAAFIILSLTFFMAFTKK